MSIGVGAKLVLGSLLPTATQPLFYDVIERHKLPPAEGCVPWASLPEWDRYWSEGRPPAGVGASCVQHGRGNPLEPCAHSRQFADCVRNETGWDQPAFGLSYCAGVRAWMAMRGSLDENAILNYVHT